MSIEAQNVKNPKAFGNTHILITRALQEPFGSSQWRLFLLMESAIHCRREISIELVQQ